MTKKMDLQVWTEGTMIAALGAPLADCLSNSLCKCCVDTIGQNCAKIILAESIK